MYGAFVFGEGMYGAQHINPVETSGSAEAVLISSAASVRGRLGYAVALGTASAVSLGNIAVVSIGSVLGNVFTVASCATRIGGKSFIEVVATSSCFGVTLVSGIADIVSRVRISSDGFRLAGGMGSVRCIVTPFSQGYILHWELASGGELVWALIGDQTTEWSPASIPQELDWRKVI